jgi:uncharacterized membrane protein
MTAMPWRRWTARTRRAKLLDATGTGERMLIAVILCVEVLAALGGLAAAGFFAFLTVVLRGLRTLPTADGIKAMNAINLATAKPIKLMLSATSLLCLAAALIWYLELGAVMALAGGAAFGLGAILVTVERSVPLNKYLGTATDAPGEMMWRIYHGDPICLPCPNTKAG